MCGIAGILDLSGKRRPAPAGAIRKMADAIIHRGPDEDGYLERPGLSFASRRLSIVGLSDGRQPVFNEDRSVAVVFNGELFDYPEQKAALEASGHRFYTHCDTEVIPHRWEDHQEGMFDQLRGQFAVALWDENRRRVILGRDHFGVCPLFWTRQNTPEGEWLLFASEIKALLASGMVEARPDPRGINHLFTFFSMPGPVTCFQGVQALTPGHYLQIKLGGDGETARVSEHTYWKLDFPDAGQEYSVDPKKLVDEFEEVLLSSVKRRLRADVPVVSYISGGVDSSIVVAMSSKVRGSPIASFTIRIQDPKLDEVSQAEVTARYVGTKPVVVEVGAAEVLSTYPRLIRAAESPVVDTSCTALMLLAGEVHRQGYKVALTGEGADEWLAGYSWHKVNRALGYLDVIPGLSLSTWVRGLMVKAMRSPAYAADYMSRADRAVGGHNGWLDLYGLMSLSKNRFYSPWMKEQTAGLVPFEDLSLDAERMRRWHPLNRELCLGGRAHLPGLLLNAKGDRVAMANSVETRYPFLDVDVFTYLSRVHPKWKLGPFLREKLLLRKVAERWLPREVAWRRKGMFRAPLDSFHLDPAPAFVEQLLSPEALRKTGYFDPEAVTRWRRDYQKLRAGGLQRTSVEMGLVAVTSTQLWHQTFIDPSLADVPSDRVASGEWRAASEAPNGAASPTSAGDTRHSPLATRHP